MGLATRSGYTRGGVIRADPYIKPTISPVLACAIEANLGFWPDTVEGG